MNPERDAALLLVFAAVVYALLGTRLRTRRFWQATLTPLASIIGSGFLVVAPLLYFIVGDAAVLAMAGIVLVAYAVGAAIRFNILQVEPLLRGRAGRLAEMESLSNLMLTLAYVVSVAFYTRLLASFVFQGLLQQRHPLAENALTTAILLFIGWNGFRRGLDRLERLEEYAVSIKLAVIAALLVGYGWHDAQQGLAGTGVLKPWTWETWRTLGGILLVVQGFETSKYLGDKYSAAERVRSMRWAQILSGLIYVGFVALATPLLPSLPQGHADETAIIALSRQVSVLLAYLLMAGALMSQFSAAVADTIGAGGLMAQETQGRVSTRLGYLAITLLAVALVWGANIFEIIAYASRAFAAYYLVQSLMAWWVARQQKRQGLALLFATDALLMAFIVLWGRAVG